MKRIIKLLALSLVLFGWTGCDKLTTEFGRRLVYFSRDEVVVKMNLYDEEKDAPSIVMDGMTVYRSGDFEDLPTVKAEVVLDEQVDLTSYEHVVPASMVQKIEPAIIGKNQRMSSVKVVFDRQALKTLDEDFDWYIAFRLVEPEAQLNPDLTTCLVRIHFI